MLSPDLYQQVLAQIKSIRLLGVLAQTCKPMSNFLQTSRDTWVSAATHCIGQWPPPVTKQPHADDWKYLVKLRVCPWLSVPQKIRVPMFEQFEIAGSECCVEQTLEASPSGKNLLFQMQVAAGPLFHRDRRISMVIYKPRPFRTMKMHVTELDQNDLVPTPDAQEMITPIRAEMERLWPGVYTEWRTATIQRVHKSAVALIFPGDDEFGLFFFVQLPNGTVRLARRDSTTDAEFAGCVLFKTGEYWLVRTGELYYVGPRGDRLLVVDELPDSDTATEFSDDGLDIAVL